MFTGTISLTSYADNYPVYEIDFVNGVATKWRGMSPTLSWEDYTGDPTVTGSTRIWRYRLNPTSGSSSHLACSKIALGSNNLSATISSTGTVENITSDENAFVWFYIGDNENLFFFNGRYYDAQPKVINTETWQSWTGTNNVKSGTKYTLNTATGNITSSTTGGLNFNNFYYAGAELTENDYVSLSGLVTTDGGNTSIGLYYWNGKFYTSAPTKKNSTTWESVSENDNYKTCTLMSVDSDRGEISYGTYYLFLNSGQCCQYYQDGGSGTTYYLSNDNTKYAIVSIGNSTVYYFQGRFYSTSPTPYASTSQEYVRVTDSDITNSEIMNVTEGFYESGGRILSIYGGFAVGSGNSRYWEQSFGEYTLGTATIGGNTDQWWTPSSRGPYVGYERYGTWYYSGNVSNGVATISFGSGNGYDSVSAYITTTAYVHFTAPSSYYYVSDTYDYTTPQGIKYQITFSSGKFISHTYEKIGYSFTASDSLADRTYYYISSGYNNRIVISSGNFSSHEYKSVGYKYQAQGNFLDGEFITNENEYASIYKYIFSNGFFSKIQVQKETVDQTEHSFSTPSSGSYTDFYMWTKTADISTSASGSPLGERNLLFKNNSNGKIGLYFNSSGHLIRVRSMGSTDYTNFLMFRCRSKWNEDTKWDDDFGLVFINGYLLKTNTTLSN